MNNPLHDNFIAALHSRDVTYLLLAIIAALVIGGYYFVQRVPVPGASFRRVLQIGYWVAVSVTYVTIVIVSTLL